MGHEYVELKNYNMAIECYRNAIDVSILGPQLGPYIFLIILVDQLKHEFKIFNIKIQHGCKLLFPLFVNISKTYSGEPT